MGVPHEDTGHHRGRPYQHADRHKERRVFVRHGPVIAHVHEGHRSAKDSQHRDERHRGVNALNAPAVCLVRHVGEPGVERRVVGEAPKEGHHAVKDDRESDAHACRLGSIRRKRVRDHLNGREPNDRDAPQSCARHHKDLATAHAIRPRANKQRGQRGRKRRGRDHERYVLQRGAKGVLDKQVEEVVLDRPGNLPHKGEKHDNQPSGSRDCGPGGTRCDRSGLVCHGYLSPLGSARDARRTRRGRLRQQLVHPAIVAEKAVGLLLHVRELRVHVPGKPLNLERACLVEKRPHRKAPFLQAGKPRVAIGFREGAVTLNVPGEPAKLRDHKGARRATRKVRAQLPEVVVLTHKVTAALVKPTAGSVDGPRGVDRAHAAHRIARAELPPTLVEEDPRHDAGMVSQVANRTLAVTGPLLLVGRVCRGEPRLVGGGVVSEVPAGKAGQGGSRAAAHHVLPDEHAHAVAEPVPAVLLNLDVLAQHVEAEVPCSLDVCRQCFLRGRGENPVRPIPLIEKPAQEEWLVVEAEARHTRCVRLNRDGAEGAVARHQVRTVLDAQPVEIGVIRAP